MLDEIERVAAAREKANPGQSLSAKGMTIVCGGRGDVARFITPRDGGVFAAFHYKEFVLAAANLDWPGLVARMRALEAVYDAIVAEREADDDRPGTPYGPEQTDDHDAAVERTDAALEAARETG
jgi:hypothetical protein